MKKLVLFIFILSSVSIFGQKNEIVYAYQAFNSDFIKENPLRYRGYQTSIFNKDFLKESYLSYYRNITTRHAIGLRVNYNSSKVDYGHYIAEAYEGSLDLIHRQNFLKKGKFRLLGELGVSLKRNKQHNETIQILGGFFCGVGMYFPPTLDHGWVTTNFLGITSGLGCDVQIFKIMTLGLNYNVKRYVKDDAIVENVVRDHKDWDMNLSLNLGVKF